MKASDHLRLAKAERRDAHDYRRWALEDKAAGRTNRYRENLSIAIERWRQAKANIRFARMCTNASKLQIQTFARAA